MKLLGCMYYKANTPLLRKESLLLSNAAMKPQIQVCLGCKVYERYVNRICVAVGTNARKSNISNILHISDISKSFKLLTHLNKKGVVCFYVRPYVAPILYPEDGGTGFLRSVGLLPYFTCHILYDNILCHLLDRFKFYIKIASA